MEKTTSSPWTAATWFEFSVIEAGRGERCKVLSNRDFVFLGV